MATWYTIARPAPPSLQFGDPRCGRFDALAEVATQVGYAEGVFQRCTTPPAAPTAAAAATAACEAHGVRWDAEGDDVLCTAYTTWRAANAAVLNDDKACYRRFAQYAVVNIGALRGCRTMRAIENRVKFLAAHDTWRAEVRAVAHHGGNVDSGDAVAVCGAAMDEQPDGDHMRSNDDDDDDDDVVPTHRDGELVEVCPAHNGDVWYACRVVARVNDTGEYDVRVRDGGVVIRVHARQVRPARSGFVKPSALRRVQHGDVVEVYVADVHAQVDPLWWEHGWHRAVVVGTPKTRTHKWRVRIVHNCAVLQVHLGDVRVVE